MQQPIMTNIECYFTNLWIQPVGFGVYTVCKPILQPVATFLAVQGYLHRKNEHAIITSKVIARRNGHFFCFNKCLFNESHVQTPFPDPCIDIKSTLGINGNGKAEVFQTILFSKFRRSS